MPTTYDLIVLNYENGNFEDFRRDLRKLSKLQLLTFLTYFRDCFENDKTPTDSAISIASRHLQK